MNQYQTTKETADAGCCGGPTTEGIDACCVKDANAKAAGESGCGCGSSKTEILASETTPTTQSCCG